MLARENRIAPIAALVAMFVVSATIVGLTYWSGDLFGPWTSVPPAIIEQSSAGAMPPMRKSAGAADPAAAFRASRGKGRAEAAEAASRLPGSSAGQQAARDAE